MNIIHYSFSELRAFIAAGHEHGANGMLLIAESATDKVYKGFGTIDRPRMTMITWHTKKCPEYELPQEEDMGSYFTSTFSI